MLDQRTQSQESMYVSEKKMMLAKFVQNERKIL